MTYSNGLFVAIAFSGTGNRAMTSGFFGGAASADPANWITIPLGLPLSARGTCDGLDDKVVAYGTGLTGGWQRAWEPWVNTLSEPIVNVLVDGPVFAHRSIRVDQPR